jgi:hypothetical protein
LGEPIKELKNGKPILTYRWESILKKNILNFDRSQKGFEKHIITLIKEALKSKK